MGEKEVVYLYNGTLLSHEKEQNAAICSNMNRFGGTVLSETSQTEKDKYCIISHVESESTTK